MVIRQCLQSDNAAESLIYVHCLRSEMRQVVIRAESAKWKSGAKLSMWCLQSENVADVHSCTVYKVKIWQRRLSVQCLQIENLAKLSVQCLQSENLANSYPSVSTK